MFIALVVTVRGSAKAVIEIDGELSVLAALAIVRKNRVQLKRLEDRIQSKLK